MRSELRLLVLVFVVWISISSASILVILSNASAEACAFWRLLISSIMLYTLQAYRNRLVDFNLRRVKWYHVIAGLSLALHFILWMRSLFLIPVYISTLLVTLYPLYGLIGEIAILHYKPPRLQVASLILSIVLLALYLNIENLVLNEGAMLALFGGLAVAIYFEVGRYARSIAREDTVSYASRTYLLSAIFVLIYGLVTGAELFNYPARAYLFFFLLAVIPMIFGHTLINYILARYPASLATMIALGEPFGAGLLAYAILGQSVSPDHLFYGLALVVLVFFTLTRTVHRSGVRDGSS